MPDASRNGRTPALGSDWGGLSQHLIASFFPVQQVQSADGRSFYWVRDPNGAEVKAPITDANLEISLNWTSPFEGAAPDQKFSAVSAMIQAGVFSHLAAELGARFDSDTFRNLSEKAKTFENGSNFSRLNSLQSFTGMPPARIPIVAHFKAQTDARIEVKRPVDQLIQWSLPQSLSDYGLAGEAINGRPGLYQSEAPRKIGMKYGDMLLLPLVVESVSLPLAGQRTRDGVLAYAAVHMQLATLAALDSRDWSVASAYSARTA